MTTAAPARAPTPRLKAAPTSSTNPDSATGVTAARPVPPTTARTASTSSSAPSAPVAPVSGQTSRRPGRTAGADPLSDRATAALIRRVLCPHEFSDKERQTPAPIEELLPPLTSRNDVDLQLYAIIAIVLREFVQNWYNKITPDETFVTEVVQIIAHCTRALEQRLRKVDLESLLFDELPELLDSHVQAYRAAHRPTARPPLEVDPREVYHSLCPLPPLSPVPRLDVPQTVAEQAENEMAYRQLLVRGVLAVLLPTEDLENDCLTSLVGQIFSELIIGGVVARKASEPWLIWEGLAILARVIRQKTGAGAAAAAAAAAADASSRGRGDTSSADSRRPGTKLSTLSTAAKAQPPRGFSSSSLTSLFWAMLQVAFAAFAFLKLLVASVANSRTIPSRRRSNIRAESAAVGVTDHKAGQQQQQQQQQKMANPALATRSAAAPDEPDQEPVAVPVVAFRMWSTMSNLIEMDKRMPWLVGTLSMAQWLAMTGPGQVANVDGFLDRLFSYSIRRAVLDPSQLPPLLRTLRGVLFPNNSLGSPTLIAPSSEAELLALRRRCASALWGLVPRGAGRLFFGAGGGGLGLGLSLFAPRSGPRGSGGGQSRQPVLSTGPGLGRGPRRDEAKAAGSAAPAPTVTASSQGPGSGSSESNSGESKSASAAGGAAVAAAAGADSLLLETDGEEQRILSEIETGVLDIFSDAYCNRHLMYAALELVLVRLMPELAEKGVLELWDERLS